MDVQYDHFSAVAINNPDALQRFAAVMRNVRKESNVYFFPTTFKSLEEKIAFFEERGLHVELCPFYTDDTQLNILYGFDAEGQARMKHLMKSFHIWKMTASEEKNETIHRLYLKLPDVQLEYDDEFLYIHSKKEAKIPLDDLTSELLRFFDGVMNNT